MNQVIHVHPTHVLTAVLVIELTVALSANAKACMMGFAVKEVVSSSLYFPQCPVVESKKGSCFFIYFHLDCVHIL